VGAPLGRQPRRGQQAALQLRGRPLHQLQLTTHTHLELVLRAPEDVRLRGLVRGYQGFAERTTAPLCRREIPGGDVVVILDFDRGWDVDGTRLRSFASGLYARPALVAHDGAAHSLQVDLTPLGALLGRDADRLVDALATAPGWKRRFALLDAALARRADDAPPPRADVAYAWRRLAETHGTTPVAALTRELRCSRRHLASRFREEVGLTPKAFARVVRFRRAADLLRDGRDLAATAAACGYADQAHMHRDFKALAGITPVTFLQDTGPAGTVASPA
jgi:AraC-like DNA-binding protein